MAGRAAIIWAAIWGTALTALAADQVPPPTPAVSPLDTPVLPQPTTPVAPVAPLPTPRVTPAVQQPSVAPKDPNPDPLAPFLPQPPEQPEVLLPDGGRVNLPATVRQYIRFSPRYGQYFNAQSEELDKTTRRTVLTGGIVVSVVYFDDAFDAQRRPYRRAHEVEFATDTAVVWTKNAKSDSNVSSGISSGGTGDDRTETEMYLRGNVTIRTLTTDDRGNKTAEHTMRADEIYYDVGTDRAIALCADVEIKSTGFPDAFHLRGREIWQLGRNEFRSFGSDTYASKLPASPGVKFTANEARLIQRQTVRRNIFGIPYRDRTGQVEYGFERILYSQQVRTKIYDFPIAYLPRTRTNIDDPLGPLVGFGFGSNRIFGFQAYVTWDMYDLIGRRAPQSHKWRLYTDYLSKRGPGLGTEYDYSGLDFFGLGKAHNGFVRTYLIRDQGEDNLGGDRGPIAEHPEIRGRFQWRHNQELYEHGTTFVRLLTQVDYLSDQNFLEQYYKYEFDANPNHETFGYLTGGAGNVGGSLLFEGNWQRQWVTETEWLPRADGYLIGESLFNWLSYSARGDVGYAGLRPTTVSPLPVLPTDQRVETGRFHLNQKLSAPFDLGPFRLDPYGVMDLAYYTEDLTGEDRGRFYGGGGTRASVTLSKLYPNAESEIFNVRGLYHKVNIGANYLAARSDTPYTQLPQLDRLSDDATDFGYRLARPRHQVLIPGADGVALSTSPIFDPQRVAIRRAVDNKVDTLDSLQVLQLGMNQRLQTKRGFPGSEHTVDWMTLDLSMSVYPDKERDNFGESTAFLEYAFLWHLGDRTSLASAGWYDPFDVGTRYMNVGINFNRPDGTNFFLSYRHTDPIDSRALTASVSYNLSRKYSVVYFGSYDFGTNTSLSNQLNFARVGTDTTVVFGFSYNALVNNFGFQFAIVPNIAALTTGQVTQGTGQLFGGGNRSR